MKKISKKDSQTNQESPTHSKNERKRKLEESQTESNKRSHKDEASGDDNESVSDDMEVHLKLLIPSTSAGGVIGRGGEKIAQIQKDSSVRMKMSKANDFYTNTCERICLIIGSLKGVLKAHDFIVERIQEKQHTSDTNTVKSDPEMAERLNQVKSFD